MTTDVSYTVVKPRLLSAVNLLHC